MKTYGSKFIYFGAISIISINMIFLTYVFSNFYLNDNLEGAIAASFMNGCFLIALFYYLRNYIYLEGMDDSSILGNIFFKKIVSNDSIEIKQVKLVRWTYAVTYKGRKYYFGSLPNY